MAERRANKRYGDIQALALFIPMRRLPEGCSTRIKLESSSGEDVSQCGGFMTGTLPCSHTNGRALGRLCQRTMPTVKWTSDPTPTGGGLSAMKRSGSQLTMCADRHDRISLHLGEGLDFRNSAR